MIQLLIYYEAKRGDDTGQHLKILCNVKILHPCATMYLYPTFASACYREKQQLQCAQMRVSGWNCACVRIKHSHAYIQMHAKQVPFTAKTKRSDRNVCICVHMRQRKSARRSTQPQGPPRAQLDKKQSPHPGIFRLG